MIPQPGETAGEMFKATGWRMPHNEDPSELAVFYHDVDPELAAEAQSKERRDSGSDEPWPLAAWPNVSTHFIVCRKDRFFPADWLRSVVRDRLGIEPDELDSGHTPALSHPIELVALMESYRWPLKARPIGRQRVRTKRAMVADATSFPATQETLHRCPTSTQPPSRMPSSPTCARTMATSRPARSPGIHCSS